MTENGFYQNDRHSVYDTHYDIEMFRYSSASLGSLCISSLSLLSRRKIDALQCHLKLELSLQHKHRILQTKLAQLNQLRSINEELIHLNALIKRDMSLGQSSIEYLRRLKNERKQLVCDWKFVEPLVEHVHSNMTTSVCQQWTYSSIMKQIKFCPMEINSWPLKGKFNEHLLDVYQCRTRDDLSDSFSNSQLHARQTANDQTNIMQCKLA
jgi:hypothetical protein